MTGSSYNNWINSRNWEISDIQKFKFTEQDIYVYVSWEPTNLKKFRTIPLEDGKIVRSGDHWVVHWHDSWVELTNLNSSANGWHQFYNKNVWPKIRCLWKYLDEEAVIISHH